MTDQPVPDEQTANPDGSLITPVIDGLAIRELLSIPDDRGEVCELYRDDWGILPHATPQAYLTTVQPGITKGWVRHESQHDRIATLFGRLHWAWYDDRPDSPTRGTAVHRVFTDRRRALIVTPPGVWHAVRNVGSGEASFVNLPTRRYDHARPDKERLPMGTSLIPFAFPATP